MKKLLSGTKAAGAARLVSLSSLGWGRLWLVPTIGHSNRTRRVIPWVAFWIGGGESLLGNRYADCTFTESARPYNLGKNMPDWKRIIIGDAFTLPSHSFDYYRDMFLVWPILAFSGTALVQIIAPASPAYRTYGFKLAVCAIVAVFLAKERLILIAGGAAFVALRLAFALAITQDWRTYLVGFLVSSGIWFAALLMRKGWAPSYAWPAKRGVLSLAVGVAGLGTAVAIGAWLKP